MEARISNRLSVETKEITLLMGKRIKFNVGGKIFEVFANTLKRYPNSRLARLNEESESFNCVAREHFFDRNPVIFGAILEACRSGELHIPREYCSSIVKRELEFWGISPTFLSSCCWKTFYRADNDTKTMNALSEFYKRHTNLNLMMSRSASRRTKLWLFLDEPRSSKYAMIWAVFMTFIVVTTTFVLTSETVSSFRVASRNEKQKETIDFFMKLAGKYNSTDSDVTDAYKYPHPALKITELVCFCFLTLDIVFRVAVCPSPCIYFRSVIHICEIIALVGDWLDFYVDNFLEHLKSEAGFYLSFIVKFLLVFQVVRLFRVARHIMAFNIMSLSVHSSLPEIGVLFVLLLILMTVFGWLMYLAEVDSDKFASMFAAMYWALITLTTVGYGDLFPDTIFGHIIACTCAVCGVVVLSLPIGVIAASFNTYYSQHKYVSSHIKGHKSNDVEVSPAQHINS